MPDDEQARPDPASDDPPPVDPEPIEPIKTGDFTKGRKPGDEGFRVPDPDPRETRDG